MTTDTNSCAEKQAMGAARPWDELLQDLTAVDAWIVHRAIEILDDQVIKHGPKLRNPQVKSALVTEEDILYHGKATFSQTLKQRQSINQSC